MRGGGQECYDGRMSTSLRQRGMTRAEFFAWEPPDDRRYEFDGFAPVAMTGGTINHHRIVSNVYDALRSRLRGSACEAMAGAGLATSNDAVRYPDALVTRGWNDGESRLVEGVVVVFEVLSPSTGRTDRIDKLREYQAVPSIRRYVILESRGVGLTVFERADGVHAWTASSLVDGDVLRMPEIGIEVPVDEFYERVEFRSDAAGDD